MKRDKENVLAKERRDALSKYVKDHPAQPEMTVRLFEYIILKEAYEFILSENDELRSRLETLTKPIDTVAPSP